MPRSRFVPLTERGASTTPPALVDHASQNGVGSSPHLFWIDPQGRRIDMGPIPVGGHRSVRTYVGEAFVAAHLPGRCRGAARIGDVLSGTVVGTSRYRMASLGDWPFYLDQALTSDAEPTRAALEMLAAMLRAVRVTLPPAAWNAVRHTPIFLNAMPVRA